MRTTASITVLASFVAFVAATPATIINELEMRQATLVCASGTPQCCDVDVLGVADLDCSTPTTVPTTVTDFEAICAAEGKIDMCCLIPILEQGLLCSNPI